MTVSSTSYLNQIFYKNNKFDDPLSLIQLEKWMLIDRFMSLSTRSITEVQETFLPLPIQNESIEPVARTIVQRELLADFSPTKEDTLFWCAYTVHHGEAGYQIIGNRYRNTEIQEKQKILDYVRTNPLIFKGSGNCSDGTTHKISNVCIQEVQSELMVNKKTTWVTFWMMCVFYQFHAIVQYDQTYMEFRPFIANASGHIETFVFTRSRDGHISVDLTPLDHDTSDRIKTIHNNCIKLDHTRPIDQPMKSSSNYKVAELEEMGAKLGILKETLGVKPKKADWYAAISNKCKW